MSREKPEYCDFCDYETDVLKFYEGAVDPGVWLCTVCATTLCGNYAVHPTVHPTVNADVLKTIARTTHMILDALKERAT